MVFDAPHLMNQLRLGTEIDLPAGLRNIEVETMGHELGRLRLQMRAYVLSDHLAPASTTETTTVEAPATTWQMWKHRNADRWWGRHIARWWPPRLTVRTLQVTVTFDRDRLFPEAGVQLPDSFGAPVLVDTQRPTIWEEL